MSVGKRLSTDEPLTEHDVAERLDAAALRVWRIMSEARQFGLTDAVKGSRYWHGAVNHLRAEMDAWHVEPWGVVEARRVTEPTAPVIEGQA